MGELNIGGGNTNNTYQNQDTSNVSIKHITHTHSANSSKSPTMADQVSTSSSVVDDVVPPPEAPQLDTANPQASKKPLKAKNSDPKVMMNQKVQTKVDNLAPETLAQLSPEHATDPTQIKEEIIFAYDHPDVDVDPKIREMAEQIRDQSAQEVRTAFKLPDSWKPPAPDTAAKDQVIADKNNENFEQLAQTKYDPQTANKIIFLHYNPDAASEMPPEIQDAYNETEDQALAQTAQEEGLPDGWKPPADTLPYNTKISNAYDQAFKQLVMQDPTLTSDEKAELLTLHYSPDTKLPDAEELQSKLSDFNDEAASQVKEQFSLPDDFDPKPNTVEHDADLQGTFMEQFSENMDKVQPPLTQEQKDQLLATNGFNTQNLPPDLKAVFDKLKTTTLQELQQQAGFPPDWQPKKITAPEDATTSKTEDAEGSNVEGSSEGEATDETGAPRIQAVGGKGKKEDNISDTSSSEYVKESGNSSQYDPAIKQSKYYQESMAVAKEIINTYSLSGLEAGILMGDFMKIVSAGLDLTRRSAFAMQASDANAARTLAVGQKDTQVSKTQMQQKQLKEAQDQGKVFFLFDVFKAFPIVGQYWTTVYKFEFWVMDIMTGGLISTLCQLMHVQPPGENPFVTVGWMSKEDAQTMDLVLQILAMVAEMVISAILAQPELVAALLAEMSAEIAEQAIIQAIKQMIKAMIEALVKGLETGAQEGVVAGIKAAGRELSEGMSQVALKDAIKDTADAVGEAVLKAAKEGPEAMKNAAKEAWEDASDSIAKAFSKEGKESLKESGRAAVETVKEVGNKIIDRVMEVADDLARLAEEENSVAVRKLRKAIEKLIEEIETGMKESLNGAKESIKATGKGLAEGSLREWMMMKDLVDAMFGMIQAICQVVIHIRNAKKAKELAHMQAFITHSDATLKVQGKAIEGLIECLEQLAKWVDDINKQEGMYWKQMEIRHISA